MSNETVAIVLDTETTGFNEPDVVEVAYLPVVLEPGELRVRGSHYYQRFKPSKPIEVAAMATHHIIAADLEECRPSSAWEFPAGVQYVIGHNIDFDCVAARVPATVKRICTLALARDLLPDAAHKQTALLYHYLPHDDARRIAREAHNALADVKMCALILNCMLPELGRPATFEALWERSEEARLPKVMTFGKHKGVPVNKVPMDYRFWYARQDNPDPWLLKAWKLA
jgi:exodeoxyribonuclease X